MKEEEKKKFEQLLRRVERLEEENLKLRAAATIPFEVDAAFRKRLSGVFGVTVSADSPNTLDQAVDEGGASTYSVMKEASAVLQLTINGTVYKIGAFA